MIKVIRSVTALPSVVAPSKDTSTLANGSNGSSAKRRAHRFTKAATAADCIVGIHTRCACGVPSSVLRTRTGVIAAFSINVNASCAKVDQKRKASECV
ncbi:hypothetical protein EVA_11031 [gut metagenome]|uniref:Uncharacterized protein n=1 Tax=gut metagenome TaxID=749906 RepID=J9CL92_9ZZZZ